MVDTVPDHGQGAQPVSLRLSNDMRELPRLMEATEAFARALGVGDRGCHDLQVAFEEVFVNVVTHAFPANERHALRVELDATSPRAILARFIDDGPPFDPLARPEPDTTAGLDERGIGGLGILFVRRLMDETTYHRDGNHNVLSLKKYFPED